jgi:coproporphyrinogen III oxidase-like Fe-S oxidoreductase
LSWYQLTLEPNTVFHARPPQGMPDDEQGFEIQSRGQERLAGLGFAQYEVSAWVRDDRPSAHNLNYWGFGDYLAVGAGAHAKISSQEGVWRYAKPANPQQYMRQFESGEPVTELAEVPAKTRLFEFMLNASRLNRDLSSAQFTARTGLPAEVLHDSLRLPIEKGLVAAASANSWRVTALGKRFLNDLQAEFLPD